MPTYEYRCLKCKKKFEKLQSMKEARLKKCVYCSGPVERLIGAGAGLIFKGSGFYQTDYKKQTTGDKGQPAPGGKTEAKKEAPPKKKE